MAAILHSLRMTAATDDVFQAVAADDVFRAWWRGDRKVRLRRKAVQAGQHVTWECVDGPLDWIGTDITFDLERDGDETVVRFTHANWPEGSRRFAEHTTKWASVLFALKSNLETPDAEDVLL